jgi:hypothetical protein
MAHLYLILEFAKIFNWNERVLEVRIMAGWANVDMPLVDKKIRGQIQDECLKFKLPLKVQVAKPSQLVSELLK